MNSAKIIIATVVIILLTSILSSCSSEQIVSNGQALVNDQASPAEVIKMARELTKEVSINLESEIEDNTVVVKIMLDNPENKPITSVESWLSYNPKALKGVSVSAENSPFEFTAPYNNTFDNEMGLLMIGRGSNKPINDKEILVAELTFEILSKGTTMLDVYDYKQDLSGHASVNMMYNGFPYNILIQPQSPVLIIEN